MDTYIAAPEGRFKTRMFEDRPTTGHEHSVATLIWGDRIEVLEADGDWVRVRGRTGYGWISGDAVGTRALLEIYVIDVGQGDGILIRTPDDRWHLVDAGTPASFQRTKKGAANFIRWKFQNELRRGVVELANVVVTHHDFDHFGGMLDVLSGEPFGGSDRVKVENFHHGGLGIFRSSPTGGAILDGEVDPFPQGDHGIPTRGTFVTELFDGKDTFANPSRDLGTTFARYAGLVSTVPETVRRISSADGHLPGYGLGDGEVTIRVLGPILEAPAPGGAGLRWLGSESVTRNGHSVVLRLDYGSARILLTGDLNSRSERLLLSYHPEEEFAVDVAKACHHGSEDVDPAFLRAMAARATVISSGDNEDYSHPRPVVIGASGRYGRESVALDGSRLPPLVYSTELARSVGLEFASRVRVDVPDEEDGSKREVPPSDADVRIGDPETYRSLETTPVSADLVYGLVNVRTDGTHVLCATMEEKGNDFDVQVFQAGVAPDD